MKAGKEINSICHLQCHTNQHSASTQQQQQSAHRTRSRQSQHHLQCGHQQLQQLGTGVEFFIDSGHSLHIAELRFEYELQFDSFVVVVVVEWWWNRWRKWMLLGTVYDENESTEPDVESELSSDTGVESEQPEFV
jgi:hypothetical protein